MLCQSIISIRSLVKYRVWLLRDLRIRKRSSKSVGIVPWYEDPWTTDDLRGRSTLVIWGVMLFALTLRGEKLGFHCVK